MKVGEQVTKTKLHKVYWYGVAVELKRLGYVEGVQKERKGGVAKYTVLKEFPSPEDLKKETAEKLYTASLQSQVEDAVSEVECLTEEMTEWRDNMEGTGLESTSKFEEVQAAADELESLDPGDLSDIPGCVADIPITINPLNFPVSYPYRTSRPRTGRGWRASECASLLLACKDAAEEKKDEIVGCYDGLEDNEISAEEKEKLESRVEELEPFIEKLEEIADGVGNVEFPGMF